MALQGTLDTFELSDVLRLLASTRKSGRLELRGDRGTGNVWLTDGKVVAVATDRDPGAEPEDGLFELLRSREGAFAFDVGDQAGETGTQVAVESLLAAAEQRLAEWREIEQVVPSMDAWVALAPELPAAELTVDAETWRRVVVVGSGMTVRDLGAALDLTEVAVSRVVRDLVTLGLGTVSTGPAPAAAEPVTHPVADVVDEPPAEPMPAWDDFEPEPVPEPEAHPWSDDPVTPVFAVDEPAGGYAFAPRTEPEADLPLPAEAFHALEPTDDEADEVARQLAMLSPRAAQAVAAAAAAGTEAEREAALRALDDADEPVNRSLLLKFLSSVKG